MKKAVIYARYSSDKQTEQSIEGQLSVCNKFAVDNGYTIIDSYIDRAISATTDRRPAFQKMINDSGKGKFDYVIVYKLDRFSRNRYDSALYKATLKKNNVKLISAMENITDSPESIILEAVIEGMNEYFSRELSQKVKRGQIESIKKGNWIGGVTPYGYDIINKKLVINEAEACVVRRIFNEYSFGRRTLDIATDLNNSHIKNKKGKKFTINSIMTILTNSKYVGYFSYDGVVYDSYVPPIIDKDLFDEVSERIKNNKRKPGYMKAKEKYLLSGKLYCGLCGELMVGESGTGKSGKVYQYYKCSGRKRKLNKCTNKIFKKSNTEELIIKLTKEHIFKPEITNLIIDRVVQISEKHYNNNETLKLLQAKLKEKNKQLNTILEALKNGIYNNSTQQMILDLEVDIKTLQDKIEIEELNSCLPIDRKVIEFWFSQFDGECTDDEKRNELIINSFINKIFISDDEITIVYNHSGENTQNLSLEDVEGLCSDLNEMVPPRGVEPLIPA